MLLNICSQWSTLVKMTQMCHWWQRVRHHNHTLQLCCIVPSAFLLLHMHGPLQPVLIQALGGTRLYNCALHCGQRCLKLQVQSVSHQVNVVVYWFALQRSVRAAGNKGCSKGFESDTRLCVKPLCNRMPVFMVSVCLWKNVLLSKMQRTLWIVSHYNTHKKQIAGTRTPPPFFFLTLIFQSGTVASSLCTTVIICLPFCVVVHSHPKLA